MSPAAESLLGQKTLNASKSTTGGEWLETVTETLPDAKGLETEGSVGRHTSELPNTGVGNRSRVLDGLIRMADRYHDSGSLRQAIEMYTEIVREYSETTQADLAVERLLSIAAGYERSGELHLARSLYEQLL